MSDVAAVVLPAVFVSFALGAVAYPLGSWLRAWWERVRPVRWSYRETCGRECRIRR